MRGEGGSGYVDRREVPFPPHISARPSGSEMLKMASRFMCLLRFLLHFPFESFLGDGAALLLTQEGKRTPSVSESERNKGHRLKWPEVASNGATDWGRKSKPPGGRGQKIEGEEGGEGREKDWRSDDKGVWLGFEQMFKSEWSQMPIYITPTAPGKARLLYNVITPAKTIPLPIKLLSKLKPMWMDHLRRHLVFGEWAPVALLCSPD